MTYPVINPVNIAAMGNVLARNSKILFELYNLKDANSAVQTIDFNTLAPALDVTEQVLFTTLRAIATADIISISDATSVGLTWTDANYVFPMTQAQLLDIYGATNSRNTLSFGAVALAKTAGVAAQTVVANAFSAAPFSIKAQDLLSDLITLANDAQAKFSLDLSTVEITWLKTFA
jgi:hypothetical protein